jgi:hypothetical protein
MRVVRQISNQRKRTQLVEIMRQVPLWYSADLEMTQLMRICVASGEKK